MRNSSSKDGECTPRHKFGVIGKLTSIPRCVQKGRVGGAFPSLCGTLRVRGAPIIDELPK